MIDYNITRFCILGKLKKGIAILCLTALLLTTSSISYFYWLDEKLHEQEVFAKIDSGDVGQNDNSKVGFKDNSHFIKLILKKIDQLPEGYTWEEEGREFSHEGMFYDIVSLKRSNNVWELVAASDEEETAIVAHQNTTKKDGHHFKLTGIQLMFIAPAIVKQFIHFNVIQSNYIVYKDCLYYRSLIKFFPPPDAI